MKITRSRFIIILITLLVSFTGCNTGTYVSKERPGQKKILFLIYNQALDPIGLVSILLKELRSMGHEAHNLPSAPARHKNSKKGLNLYGSGFFISEDGLFITAHHVIEQAETITIRKMNGNSFRAEVLIEDPLTDIAILSVLDEQKEKHWLPLGNYHNANIGDEVKVIGYPIPYLLGSQPKLTAGFISANAGFRGDPTKFEIRAPLQLGYSGAAILNTRNEVVGIASEQLSGFSFLTETGPLPPDINFGAKIDCAKTLIELCLEDKVLRKDPNTNNLEDVINSTALVLINTQTVPASFYPMGPDQTVLFEFSTIFGYYLIHYTLFEFNKKWTDSEVCEILLTGYIAGAPGSSPGDIVEIIKQEMRIKAKS